MNPWSRYDHKPEFVQSVLVAVIAWVALRRFGLRSGAPSVAALAALGWCVVGFLDYATYAFGFQMAELSSRQVASVQVALEWVRVVLVVVGVAALYSILASQRRS